MLKLAKNQAKAKQHPEAELLLFENYSLLSSLLPFKINIRYCEKMYKKQLHLLKGGYMITDNENEVTLRLS